LRGGSDRDPDADFTAALGYGVRRNAIDSCDGEQQREASEKEKYGGTKTRFCQPCCETFVERLGVRERYLAIDGLNRIPAGSD
jgi:hypothetical protein